MNLNKPVGQEIKQITFTRLRIIKNLIIICLTFTLLFTAFDGLSMLQSTMNGKQGIGSYSQALIYFIFAGSSLIFPNYFIKKLGCKTNLFVGTALYLPYIASNVYPTWATMMSSAVLMGLGASVLWAAQSTYFNEAAGLYCNLLNDCVQDEKTLPTDCKSEISNSKLFIIQNGISEKLISEMKSTDRFIQLDPYRANDINSKSDSLKIIPEDDPKEKTFVINTKTDCDINVVTDEKTENESEKPELNYVPFNVLNTTEHEKYNRNTNSVENFENLNSQSEHYIRKDFTMEHIGNIQTSNESPIVNAANTDKIMRLPSVEYMQNKNGNTHRSSTLESVTARFFGWFGMMFCTCQIWSNLISYFVLNVSNDANSTHTANYSCGAGFCNSKYETLNTSVDEISLETRYLLTGITSTLNVFACLLVLIFLDPLNGDGEPVTFSLGHVMATFNHLRKKEQIFMVPLSLFSGMAQGFFTADFTKSYIQCAWSISHVGLLAAFFGLTSGISSSISGWLVKYIGRIPVILFGLVLHIGIEIFLLIWNPDSENAGMFYLAAGLFGAVVGLFYSQILAFYGLLFKKDQETAFATHYFCRSMGWTLSFIYSDYLCTSIKIYILIIVSCVGVFGYLAADRKFRSRTIQ